MFVLMLVRIVELCCRTHAVLRCTTGPSHLKLKIWGTEPPQPPHHAQQGGCRNILFHVCVSPCLKASLVRIFPVMSKKWRFQRALSWPNWSSRSSCCRSCIPLVSCIRTHFHFMKTYVKHMPPHCPDLQVDLPALCRWRGLYSCSTKNFDESINFLRNSPRFSKRATPRHFCNHVMCVNTGVYCFEARPIYIKTKHTCFISCSGVS